MRKRELAQAVATHTDVDPKVAAKVIDGTSLVWAQVSEPAGAADETAVARSRTAPSQWSTRACVTSTVSPVRRDARAVTPTLTASGVVSRGPVVGVPKDVSPERW